MTGEMSETLDEIAKRVCQELVSHGTPLEIAKAFTCMRFHPQCAWGLGKVKLDGIETFAIVRPIDDSYKNVECVFITTTPDMPLSDLAGLETIPEKSQLN